MQFLAVTALGVGAILVAAFFISGLAGAFTEVVGHFPKNYGAQEAAVGGAREDLRGEVSVSAVVPAANSGDIPADAFAQSRRFEELFRASGGTTLIPPDRYTFFIPTDEAFAQLPYETKVQIARLGADEQERLVRYHLVPERMVAVGGQRAGLVSATSGDTLNFSLHENGGTVGNARVIGVYSNERGIIYLIDAVLLPPERRVPGLE